MAAESSPSAAGRAEQWKELAQKEVLHVVRSAVIGDDIVEMTVARGEAEATRRTSNAESGLGGVCRVSNSGGGFVIPMIP